MVSNAATSTGKSNLSMDMVRGVLIALLLFLFITISGIGAYYLSQLQFLQPRNFNCPEKRCTPARVGQILRYLGSGCNECTIDTLN